MASKVSTIHIPFQTKQPLNTPGGLGKEVKGNMRRRDNLVAKVWDILLCCIYQIYLCKLVFISYIFKNIYLCILCIIHYDSVSIR